jgi:PAS domain S-box-containing protein
LLKAEKRGSRHRGGEAGDEVTDSEDWSEEVAARLAAIVESSDDAIVSKTLDGVITSWNHAAERMFGYAPAEAIGRNITLIIPPDRLEEETRVLASIRAGRRVEHFETIRVAKDGRQVAVSLTVSPVKDSSGRIIGASKVARDVSERRRGEIAQARLAAIIESSEDAIISKTLDGVITSWNGAAERVFGWTAAEAIGQHITLIIPEEYREEERGVLARLRRGDRIDHFETVRQRKDGQLLDVSITVSPIRDGRGTIVGASKVARDISAQRILEQARQALLEREQAARTEAEDLNRSKDQFLATLSHELRTPLNAIYGWARMLEGGGLDPAAMRNATQAILRNSTIQVQLIEDLFDVSRVITGNMRLDVRPMNVFAPLEAALDTVRPAAAAKGIRLDTALDPRATPIMGDPGRIQQVVWNLLVNAVKFTPKGGRVELRLRRVNSHIQIMVSDTGEGIAPDQVAHLFERFRQADTGPTRRHTGLGIGLSLVKHLVELHGGTVSGMSAGLGQGSTFTVQLPVSVVQVQPPSRPRPEPRSAEDPDIGSVKPVSLRDVHVLVVDDDEESRELASLVLTNAGAETRTAPSAREAMALLEEWPPDVLVSDLEMPEEDGFSLLRRARRASLLRNRKLPALALTAYGRSEDRVRVLAAGFNLHLAKPADPTELVLAVASLVGRTE